MTADDLITAMQDIRAARVELRLRLRALKRLLDAHDSSRLSFAEFQARDARDVVADFVRHLPTARQRE